MIEISAQGLNEGKKMAQLVAQCPNALACLWEGKECKKKCGLPIFRRVCERNSPAFFGKARKFSGHNAVMHDLALAEIEGSPEQKHEAQERFYDLQTFSQIFCFAIYPLFLANGEEVPLLSVKEIEEEEQIYLGADLEKAQNELEQINSEWWNWLAAISNNFHNMENCKKWYLLVQLFLKGLEKYGPPGEFLSEEEKAKFFRELENSCFSNGSKGGD